MAGDGLWERDDGRSANAVHRAERQEEKALAILFLGMGHTCKDNFCAKTQETVKKKIPDQVHFITNIQFGQSVEKHTGKEKNSARSPVEKKKMLW